MLRSAREWASNATPLHHFVQRGSGGWATSMRFGGQRNRYTGEYALLRAERDGEYYEQREIFVEV